MRKYKQSDITKVVYFYMIDDTDHISEVIGLTIAVAISKNGAAFVAATGTVAEVGNGTYKLTPSELDVGILGPIIFRGTSAGADPSVIEGIVVAYDPYSSTNLGLSDVADTLVDTNSLNDTKIPHTLNTTALGNIGIDWENVENPTTTLNLTTTDIRTVGVVSGGVGSVVGNVNGSVGSVAGNVDGDISGDVTSLSAGAVDSILDEEVDNDGTAISLRGAQKLALSVLTGESSGGDSGTLVFRDIADTKERLSVEADSNGNRTAVNIRDAT